MLTPRFLKKHRQNSKKFTLIGTKTGPENEAATYRSLRSPEWTELFSAITTRHDNPNKKQLDASLCFLLCLAWDGLKGF